MLIANEQNLEALKGTHHKNCTLCTRKLYFPRIVIDDGGNSAYHIECALRLVGEITADMQTLLSDPDLLEHLSQTQAVNEAFRSASHKRHD